MLVTVRLDKRDPLIPVHSGHCLWQCVVYVCVCDRSGYVVRSNGWPVFENPADGLIFETIFGDSRAPQAMSDHFDHYKRPPSRDNSVDRYTRAASRLSSGSRQSSVEKQQQRRADDAPSSDKSFGGGAAAAAAAAKQQNFAATGGTTAAHRQPPPFEEIILRQRNLGQEIVPSPVGQPKRTESLYVNPNAARKETIPKVSPSGWPGSGVGVGGGGGGGCVGGGRARKPRLLPPPPGPPPPPIPPRRLWLHLHSVCFAWTFSLAISITVFGFCAFCRTLVKPFR